MEAGEEGKFIVSVHLPSLIPVAFGIIPLVNEFYNLEQHDELRFILLIIYGVYIFYLL